MRNLGRVSAAMATLAGASMAVALVVVGCGGDDNGTDGGTDSGPDMKASDHTVDVKTDTTQPDATPPDADAAPPPDAPPPDAKFFDVGEASFDVVIIPEGGFDVSLAQFPAAVNAAYCQRLETCCHALDAGVADAGGFAAGCIADFGPYSASGNLNLANTASPHVVYDPSNAKECLEQFAATPCGTETAAQSELNYLTCASAIQGQLAIGASGCTSSFDCVSGAYCPSDGGTCTALAIAGMPCKDTNYSTDCTYLGNGDPLLWCNADSGTCENDFSTGSSCIEYEQCNTQVCNFSGSTGTCASTLQFANAALCASP
jgi:hypothetical protein